MPAPRHNSMPDPIIKRSVTIDGHKTSISLESPFWDALKDIARKDRLSLNDLVAKIDKTRASGGLSSAIRIHILHHYRDTSSG